MPDHPRSRTIFSSGTRSPAPHHAAMMTSGSCRATSSAEHCAPGLPRNSPPAACTISATHGLRCDDRLAPLLAEDALSGQARGLAAHRSRFPPAFRTNDLIAALSRRRHRQRSLRYRCRCHRACAEPAQKSNARLEYFRHRGLLVGNGRDHQVRLGREDLAGLGAPRVGNDQPAADIELAARRQHSISCTRPRGPMLPHWPG